MTTLSYTDMSKLYATKAKRYDKAQCKAAIADIDATISMHPASTTVAMTPYVTKLFCERDAMLDRLLALR